MITGRISGDGAVLLKLRSMGVRVRDGLRAAVKVDAIALTRIVKEQKLSGQVLKNRTGTLRRKINSVVAESAYSVTGNVGVKLAYAAAHEYGFDGTVTIREHLRRAKGGGGRDAHGRFKGQSAASVLVHSHERHMRIPERSFLRSSLSEYAPTIRQHLRTAVVEAIQ